MKRRIGRFLAWIGAFTILLMILVGVGVYFASKKEKVPAKTILEVNFERPVVEFVPDDPFAKIMLENVTTMRDVLSALEQAATDDRVAGLVAQVGNVPMGVAQIQEIREAIHTFRKSGKPAIVFSETFGEFGPGNRGYYLASAFDRRYLQPSGDVGLTGLMAEHPFVKGTLEKIGVEPRMDHRHEYKNAMNLFTEKKFTDAHREATLGMIQSIYWRLVQDIAEDLNITPIAFRAIVERGPLLGPEALSSGLVDGLMYYDEVRDMVKQDWGKDAKWLSLNKYLDRAGDPYEDGTAVALIYGVGNVVRGKSEYDPTSGSGVMGAETVAKAFRDAVEDEKVKAIVFRVDSPGGSYVASDAIWRETVKAKNAGKPVIVTMGNVAASGGYFVSMHADKIVAQPGTITGSIGVVAGKMLTTNMWEKLGVTWDEVHIGENATFWSTGTDYSPEQWAKFQLWLDRIYDDFTGKVAKGRNLPLDQVLTVAKGRVWTGDEAKVRGLVDELGGFPTALRLVREQLGLARDAPLAIKVFPKEKNIIELIMEKGFVHAFTHGDVLFRVIGDLQPVFKLAHTMGLTHRQGVLEASVWEVK